MFVFSFLPLPSLQLFVQLFIHSLHSSYSSNCSFTPFTPVIRPTVHSLPSLQLFVQLFIHSLHSSYRLVVRRQKPIFGLKCAICGNNHFFAFFDSSWYVDKILPGWELAIGLAFSESKMAARMGDTYNLCSLI